VTKINHKLNHFRTKE